LHFALCFALIICNIIFKFGAWQNHKAVSEKEHNAYYYYEGAAGDNESAFTHWLCPSVRVFVCLSVCLPKCIHKTRFSLKLSSLELWSLLTTYRKICISFSQNPLLDPLNSNGMAMAAIFKKIVVYHTLAADCPILVKFCAGKQFSVEFRNETNPAFHRTYFVFLMQFGLQRSAHFVSSPIQLLTFCKALSVNNETQSKAPILTLHPVESYAP